MVSHVPISDPRVLGRARARRRFRGYARRRRAKQLAGDALLVIALFIVILGVRSFIEGAEVFRFGWIAPIVCFIWLAGFRIAGWIRDDKAAWARARTEESW